MPERCHAKKTNNGVTFSSDSTVFADGLVLCSMAHAKRFSDNKLATVASELLHRNKLDGIFKTFDQWKVCRGSYRNEFLRYCLRDAALCGDIWRELQFSQLIASISWYCKASPTVVVCYNTGQISDRFIFASLLDRQLVLAKDALPPTLQVGGGLVLRSVPGIYRNVLDLDVSSMYPSIAIGLNLSWETLLLGAYVSRDEPRDSYQWCRVMVETPSDLLPAPGAAGRSTTSILSAARRMEVSDESLSQPLAELLKQNNCFVGAPIEPSADTSDLPSAERSRGCVVDAFHFVAWRTSTLTKMALTCLSSDSVLATCMKDLVSQRRHIRQSSKSETDPVRRSNLEQKAFVMKILVNTFVGITNAAHKACLTPLINDLVTATGRHIMSETHARAIRESFTVPAGDTDGQYICLDDALPLDEQADRLRRLYIEASRTACGFSVSYEDTIHPIVFVSSTKHLHFFRRAGDGSFVCSSHKGGPMAKGNRAPAVKSFVERHLPTAVNVGIHRAASDFCTELLTYFNDRPLSDYCTVEKGKVVLHVCGRREPVSIDVATASQSGAWSAAASVDVLWYMWDAVTAFASVMGRRLPAKAKPTRARMGSSAWRGELLAALTAPPVEDLEDE